MTQTTNFNLNIVEGTDNVNLLTQMNPNTEAIDVQMKTNEDHGIQEATELFTSTVHAITRLKPDAKVFRFTAVSNYTAGETFTVDGVQVTALLTSGEALTTGSFIIGSEVICALRDTLLTVFVNAGTASIAKNAEKLGGELPSYYGTAEDVSSAVSNANTALETANAVSGSVGNLSALTTTDKSSCVAAINEVNSNLSKFGIRRLWENSAPSTDFVAQTIEIPNLSEYDFFLIDCKYRADNIDKHTNVCFNGANRLTVPSNVYTLRRCTIGKTENTITFDDGGYYPTYNSSIAKSNTYVVPVAIYGGKLA